MVIPKANLYIISFSGVNLVEAWGVVNPVPEIFDYIVPKKIPIFRKILDFPDKKF